MPASFHVAHPKSRATATSRADAACYFCNARLIINDEKELFVAHLH
jgi:hypothetical protein